MPVTRENHYVPQWYQKGFFIPGRSPQLFYLDLIPKRIVLPNGQEKLIDRPKLLAPAQCFRQTDLYTTSIFGFVNDEIEKLLFGPIDSEGAVAVRAFAQNDQRQMHLSFSKFFEYMDAQKLRTPKGLAWISANYRQLNHMKLLFEMQYIRQLNCTMWVEAVREIVSAKNSKTKFVVSDHPVTVYNRACHPNSTHCKFPNDPPISLLGSQTIFPLDSENCLILTNLEYAHNFELADPLQQRTNPRNFSETLARTDAMIRIRSLTEAEVRCINFLLKSRAARYIAAAEKEWLYPEKHQDRQWQEFARVLRPPEKEWLYPEKHQDRQWQEFARVLRPPEKELWHFGGEIIVGYKDGSSHYQDALGRTSHVPSFLQKQARQGKVGANEPCPCGSGKKFKKCCRERPISERPISTVRSIRERNLMFFSALVEILGLSKGKTWDDVRKELAETQVQEIHGAFSDLWPRDANIVELLPRPHKGTFRGLYAGLVDPRVVPKNVLSFSPYFDEVIMVNPMILPGHVKPEFSPLEVPGQYLQETLKIILLFVELIPFVDAGIVHIVPDPSWFSQGLRQVSWKMAKERGDRKKFDREKAGAIEDLLKDDFRRSFFGMPEELLKSSIKRALPNLSENEIRQTVEYIKAQHARDPLSVIQSLKPGQQNGQMLITHLTPNFEMGFFLAQITGSVMYTDNAYRWEEIMTAADGAMEGEEAVWAPLAQFVSQLVFDFELNPWVNLNARHIGKLGLIRKVLGNIVFEILKEAAPSQASVTLNLIDVVREAHLATKREWETIRKNINKYSRGEPTQAYSGNLNCAIANNGFGIDEIRRLLLTFGTQNFWKSMPLAFRFS
jgi:hypothetical protein